MEAPTTSTPTRQVQQQLAPDRAAELARLDRLAFLLDSKWRIPGTSRTFGVDAVAGLIPGVGDIATGLVSAHIIREAVRLGIPNALLARMVGNVALDVAVGTVPLLGSVFDLFFKANRRNMRLLRRHLEADADTRRG